MRSFLITVPKRSCVSRYNPARTKSYLSHPLLSSPLYLSSSSSSSFSFSTSTSPSSSPATPFGNSDQFKVVEKQQKELVCILPRTEEKRDLALAESLAAELGIEIVTPKQASRRFILAFYIKHGKISISEAAKGFSKQNINFRYVNETLEKQSNWRNSPLLRGLHHRDHLNAHDGNINKLANIRVLDTSAGWGVDCWTVAKAGYSVIAVERDPIMNCLLSRALTEARRSPVLSIIADRIQLLPADSIHVLEQLNEAAGSSQEVQAQTTKEDETEDQNPDYVIMDYLHPAFSWGGRSTPSKAMLRNRLIGLMTDPMDVSQISHCLSLALKVAKRGVVHSFPFKHSYNKIKNNPDNPEQKKDGILKDLLPKAIDEYNQIISSQNFPPNGSTGSGYDNNTTIETFKSNSRFVQSFHKDEIIS